MIDFNVLAVLFLNGDDPFLSVLSSLNDGLLTQKAYGVTVTMVTPLSFPLRFQFTSFTISCADNVIYRVDLFPLTDCVFPRLR